MRSNWSEWAKLQSAILAEGNDFVRTDVVATKHPRKCPMCGVMHHWPADDKLCYYCEGVWEDICENGEFV